MQSLRFTSESTNISLGSKNHKHWVQSLDLNFNIEMGTIEVPGQEPTTLTRSERAALKLLSSNPNRVITRDQLLDAVSGYGSDKNDRNVDFLINRLRKKLLDDARQPRFIATRYGEGYVWVAQSPTSLNDIAEADVVVGPVRGLELVQKPEIARQTAQTVALALSNAFGKEKRVVYAPECPPPGQFGAAAPDHATEITFFSDRGRTDCIFAVKEFRSGQIVFARRLELDQILSGGEALKCLSDDIFNSIWRAKMTTQTRSNPLPVSLLLATGEDETPLQEAETASHRRLLSTHTEKEKRNLAQWVANEKRLRGLLEQSPNDAELKILIAINIHAKYIMAGAKLFASGHNTRAADEDDIENFVTQALPSIQSDPEYAIIAGKLLHFIKRGYDDLAHDLCEGAVSQSLSVGRSLAIIGQMRSYFGETDAALQCLDQALNLARPGSHAHLYALVMKCQTLAASGRWDALDSARRELSGVNRIAGFVMEPMFGHPDKPSVRARGLAFLLRREKAHGMLMHLHYVSARLFDDPVHGSNSIRSMTRIMSGRFGQSVIPAEIISSFPEFVSADLSSK